jgi:hypothetical protein
MFRFFQACVVLACLAAVSASAAQKTDLSAKEITALLNTPVDTGYFDEPMSFKEGLARLQEKIAEKNENKKVGFIVDQRGFAKADPESPDLYDMPVRVKKGKELTAGKLLAAMLAHLPDWNRKLDATYVVREGYVEIIPRITK